MGVKTNTMKVKTFVTTSAAAMMLSLMACQDRGSETGSSTPIDSTIENGTSPATYGGDNPANDLDTNYQNATDTGTTAASSSSSRQPAMNGRGATNGRMGNGNGDTMNQRR